MHKILGVIGGMGPEATSYYYEEVIRHTQASCDQEHIDMIILSHADMPDRTKAIISGDHGKLIETMRRDAHMLELYGAGNIAIPCNTSHYFYDLIQETVHVPIIHMVQESIRYAVDTRPNVRRVGILGTDGTINAGVYHKACRMYGVEPVVPSPEAQKDIMSLIYDDVKGGKQGDPAKFERAMANLMSKNCDVVILACTEISVFKTYYQVPSVCLDAMDVLVQESILRSGAVYI